MTFTQALVEKDWLAFGHPFADRMGMPTISGEGNNPYELHRQSSSKSGSFQGSPLHQSSLSTSTSQQSPGPSHNQISSNSSPIFFQVKYNLNCQVLTKSITIQLFVVERRILS